MILSIKFAILTFFKFFCPIFCTILGSVGMKIFFIFFLEGNKNFRVGTKKTELVVLAETQVFFLGI